MFVYIRAAAFIIVVTQKLVLKQPKNVTAKCTETLLPPPCIEFSLYHTIYAPNVLDNQSPKFKRVWLKETTEFHFLGGLNICVDFDLRDSKKDWEYEETK